MFDGAGLQTGYIGGNDGAWFRTLRLGGSSYAYGIFRADSTGAVTIDGATFTLVANGLTSVIDNATTGGIPAGFRTTDGSGYRALIGIDAGGPIVQVLRGSSIAQMFSVAAGGRISLGDSIGASGIELEGGFNGSGSWQGRVTCGKINCIQSVLVNSTQVVSTRKTGWTAATGVGSRAGFATGTATTQDVAEHLKFLMDDLISHGLIGI